MKPLDITHPIFNCFFSIKTLDVRPPYDRGKPQFLGFEDKHGRLMMIINYNNDVSDYWQWSGDPYQPLPAEDKHDFLQKVLLNDTLWEKLLRSE